MAERIKIGIYFLPDNAVVEEFLILDAVLSFGHKATSEITDHVASDSLPVADNIVPKAVELDMVGLVTNSPLDSDLVSATRVSEAWAQLEDIRLARKTVAIVTQTRTYENMGILSMAAPEDGLHAGSLQYSASFKQIRNVSLLTVPAPTPIIRNRKPEENRGTVGKDKAEDKEIERGEEVSDSWLYSAVG